MHAEPDMSSQSVIGNKIRLSGAVFKRVFHFINHLRFLSDRPGSERGFGATVISDKPAVNRQVLLQVCRRMQQQQDVSQSNTISAHPMAGKYTTL